MSTKKAKNRRGARESKGTPRPLGDKALIEVLLGGWRPLSRVDVGGFAIMRSRGITRRANSIAPIDPPTDPEELAAGIDRAESLTEAAGDPVRFRLLPENGHAEIDTLLAERGYGIEAPCELLEVPLTGTVPEPDVRARIETGPLSEKWFDTAWRLAPRAGEQARETLHDILAGTPAVHVAITADGDEVSCAVGRAALVAHGRTRAAVLNEIAVDPEHRREGFGTAVLRTLLAASAVQDADRALLEVEQDNAGARGLYRKLGFRRIGSYHYRVRN